MKKLLLTTAAALLLLLWSTPALADSDDLDDPDPPLDELEQTRRELAYLQQFDNFVPASIAIPFEELVTHWLHQGMAKRVDDRVAYELVRKNVGDERTIRDALVKARKSCTDANDSFPETMVTFLLKTLQSPRTPPSLDTVADIIARAFPESGSLNPARTIPRWKEADADIPNYKWAQQSSITSLRAEENTVPAVPQAETLKSATQSSGASEVAVPEAKTPTPHGLEPLEEIIVHAVSKAKEEIEAENKQLRRDFDFYDENEIDSIWESQLSSVEDRDIKLMVAERIDRENKKCCWPFYDEEKRRKQLLKEDSLYRKTPLVGDIKRARRKLGKATSLNNDFDKLMTDKLFTILNPKEDLKELLAELQAAMRIARRTLRLINAVNLQKLFALRSLLDEGETFAESRFRELVGDAARDNDVKVVAMLLDRSTSLEDFEAALLAAVETRIRKFRQPGWQNEEKNLQLITFLLKDKRKTPVIRETLKLAKEAKDEVLIKMLKKQQ